jgi:hypothetical protein
MKCKFVAGQRVVCIDVSTTRGHVYWAPHSVLKLGEIYTVRKVGLGGTTGNELTVWLEEVRNDWDYLVQSGEAHLKFAGITDAGYRYTRFKPLDESRLDVFRKILKSVPNKKKVTVDD